MQLPLDLRQIHRPVKPKYIDEETVGLDRWFIMGQDARDGTCHVIASAGGNQDVFLGCTREEAEALVAARDAFCDAVLAVANKPAQEPVKPYVRPPPLLPSWECRGWDRREDDDNRNSMGATD